MSDSIVLRSYKKEFDYSYTSGAYATIEMILAKPQIVRSVYVHSKYSDKSGIEDLCNEKKIPVVYNDKSFARINEKENSYVFGLFNKYYCELSYSRPHIVLVNPCDMGNLGTIIRTMAGFRIFDLAVITPAADAFNPKTVRASMGALFHINLKEYSSFEEYQSAFQNHVFFPFLLDGKLTLSLDNCPVTPLFSLIFGNEASGLPVEYSTVGTGIRIPLSLNVDSFNLSIAAGIGMFIFANRNGLI